MKKYVLFSFVLLCFNMCVGMNRKERLSIQVIKQLRTAYKQMGDQHSDQLSRQLGAGYSDRVIKFSIHEQTVIAMEIGIQNTPFSQNGNNNFVSSSAEKRAKSLHTNHSNPGKVFSPYVNMAINAEDEHLFGEFHIDEFTAPVDNASSYQQVVRPIPRRSAPVQEDSMVLLTGSPDSSEEWDEMMQSYALPAPQSNLYVLQQQESLRNSIRYGMQGSNAQIVARPNSSIDQQFYRS